MIPRAHCNREGTMRRDDVWWATHEALLRLLAEVVRLHNGIGSTSE